MANALGGPVSPTQMAQLLGLPRVTPNIDPNMPTQAPDVGGGVMLTGPTWQNLPGIQQVADQLPGQGVLPGQLFLNPKIAPQVPSGAPRPFAPGEYVLNPNGSWSSEITATINQGDAPQLNGGRATVVPTLWLVNGVPTRVDEDTAAAYAVQSGLAFRSFDTNEEAAKFADQREDSWQTMKPQQAGSVSALWGAAQ